MTATTLIIEDSPQFMEILSRIAQRNGFEAVVTESGEEGLAMLDSVRPDLVLVDIGLPGMNGIEVTRQVSERSPNTVCIIVSSQASVENTVEAMRAGAFDFIAKTTDVEEIQFRLRKALELCNLRSRLEMLANEQVGTAEILGESPGVRRVREMITEIAATPSSTALVVGDTGTGKELVARAIHKLSARRKGPLITHNCAAVPENLLESEFFGHERGAFTGADRQKKGLFELADGGTLFLDEVGELDLKLQAKLLRVLEERRFRRVGGVQDLSSDVRIVAATNRDLVQMSADKQFREDLYYRLNIFQIDLPSLRERGDDVMLLAGHFIQQLNTELGKRVTHMEPAAEKMLREYSFPGNVRQLRNLMEQAMILVRTDRLTPEHFRGMPRENGSAEAPRSSTAQVDVEQASFTELMGMLEAQEKDLVGLERRIVDKALAEADHNKTRAAGLMGISRYALQRRIQRLKED